MRAARFIVLGVLVIAAVVALVLAGRYSVGQSYASLLGAGEKGVVAQMLEKGLQSELDEYHLGNVKAAEIRPPSAMQSANALPHPQAERFFYVDAGGNVTIKGLSDENIPPDLSQKAVLLADSGLSWFKAQALFDSLIDEKIRYVYIAGLAADGGLTYVPLEVAPYSTFLVYPYCICHLTDSDTLYHYEDAEETMRFTGFEGFQKAVAKAREQSRAPKPFLKILAADNVSLGAVFGTLSMFEPAGVKAIAILRDPNQGYIIGAIAEDANEPVEQEEEEK
jgi:hypothetical protein